MVQSDSLAIYWNPTDVFIPWSAERVLTDHGNRRETGFCVGESGTDAGEIHRLTQSGGRCGFIGLQQKAELVSA